MCTAILGTQGRRPRQIGRTTVAVTVPLGFSATETFDVGMDLGSPVALEYFDRAPFAFEGTVKRVHIECL